MYMYVWEKKRKKSVFLPRKHIRSLPLMSRVCGRRTIWHFNYQQLAHKFFLFRWYEKTRLKWIEMSPVESRGHVAQLSKVSFCFIPQEHFCTNPEVSLSSTVSNSLISLLPFPPRWALWCSVSFPLAFPLPLSVLLLNAARKSPLVELFRKGWTLTFCKMFYLLLDPLIGAAALWLGCACVVSSHQARPSDRRPNRCQGAAKGVDWSLERPHYSNGTPERTPESHTLSSRPLCLSLVSPRWHPLMALFRFDESGTPQRSCLCRVVFSEAHRGSVSTLGLTL